jgi:protoheme IX farnesyltransferase
MLVGLYLVSAGSFALNQAQEWQLDKKMDRTSGRPIPSGKMSISQVYILGMIFCIFGIFILYMLQPLAALVAGITVLLYNGAYTLYWKKRWAFGAVPGAIPGALPVVIGYAVNNTNIFSSECIYLFLIMFLWQMPHFWALAVRYRDDYARGGFPVLPTQIGIERTVYHVGLYTFTYAGVAIASPWFVSTHILYIVLIVPLALKVIWEFFKFFHSKNNERWLPFFLWTNLSMLVFICVPVFDKWIMFYRNVSV